MCVCAVVLKELHPKKLMEPDEILNSTFLQLVYEELTCFRVVLLKIQLLRDITLRHFVNSY
jgi:hypothetical protein